MMKVLEPCYEIPTRTHFSMKIVPDLCEQEKIKIVNKLSKASSATLTTDGSLHHSGVGDAKSGAMRVKQAQIWEQ